MAMNLIPADPRTKAVVHYVISHTDPDKLGATKLNKVLWRADVEHYRRFGHTITGQMTYVRMPQGPVPNFVEEVLSELKAEKLIVERDGKAFDYARREFVWLDKARPTNFTAEQVEIILEAISTICKKTANAASDETHDALWGEIPNGQQMPVRAASVRPSQLNPSDIEWALANG